MTNTASSFEASVNLAKMSIGCGILALPYATVECGLILSLLLNFLIAFLNGVSCNMIIKCKDTVKNLQFPADITSTYSKIAYAALGWYGVYIVDLSIILTLVGVCVTYQITFSQLISDIPGNTFDTIQLTILSALVIYPFTCAKNVSFLSPVSLVGLVFLALGVLAIFYFGFINLPNNITPESNLPYPLWPESVSGLFSYIGVASFCYALCFIIFPVEESLKDPNEIGTAVFWALIFCWTLYALLSFSGLLYFFGPSPIQSNILFNLPNTSVFAIVIRVSIAIVCLLSPPLTLIIPAEMIEHFLVRKYPTLAENTFVNEYSVLSTSRHVSSFEIQAEDEDTRFGRKSISAHGRYVNRLVLVLIASLTAITIPCFADVISILGSCTVALLSFIIPPILHYILVTSKASNNSSQSSHFLNVSMDMIFILVGSFICVFSTIMTGYSIYESFVTGKGC